MRAILPGSAAASSIPASTIRSRSASTAAVVDTIDPTSTATHLHLDEPTKGNSFTTSAVVTDDGGLASNTSTANVEVDNVTPAFVDLSLNGAAARGQSGTSFPSTVTINEDGVVTVVGSFRDRGIKNTDTLTIDCDDLRAPHAAQ